MELKELYQEIILDHAKNPRNKGNAMDLTTMQKHTIPFAETKFIFI